ncbi:AAA family ATPase [Paraburkholderia sp. J8-2]|uniref:AAA family ATPase n=1 Tax=Paraburkholderia sp. J8-2 TaxID=2805440 RepID=UPI002AB77914|nr:AAA family ATPase [Paraburkholderia sp. J8-2]
MANGNQLIRKFIVEGLFGYRNVAINFSGPTKIVVAENGMGKTTLLNMLYWTLTGRAINFISIQFTRIRVVFCNDQEVVIDRRQLFSFDVEKLDIFSFPGRRLGVTAADQLEMMQLLIAAPDGSTLFQHEAYNRYFRRSPYDHEEIVGQLKEAVERYISRINFIKIKKRIAEYLGNTKILYLPTYRRIETSFKQEDSESSEGNQERLIFFGMSDVEQKLKAITDEIKVQTLTAYTKLNASFLDKLVATGEPQVLSRSDTAIDIEVMKLVLARIGKGEGDATAVKIEELITSGAILEPIYYHLNYFLLELAKLGKEQQPKEAAILGFKEVVNEYWDIAGREKSMEYDKYKVEVYIKNNVTNGTIPFQVLSSGEKQIVAIFSRLFFDEVEDYFVIIDEPELSLSLEWQRLFLPHIVKSNKCRSLLAITHSPYIFDNELDHLASSLETSRAEV